MRIIDKRGQDYYDGIMLSLYQDHDLLFVRNEDHEDCPEVQRPYNFGPWDWHGLNPEWPFGKFVSSFPSRVHRNRRDNKEYELILIGFCGMVYPVLHIHHWNYYTDHTGEVQYEIESEYQYNPDPESMDLCSVLNMTNGVRLFEMYKNPPKVYTDHWQKMMEEKRSPVFVAKPQERVIYWNEHLLDYDFHTIMDPYQASQKIYQFFSNLSSPEKEIPEVSDVEMAEIKGFDKDWSFRKRGKKK